MSSWISRRRRARPDFRPRGRHGTRRDGFRIRRGPRGPAGGSRGPRRIRNPSRRAARRGPRGRPRRSGSPARTRTRGPSRADRPAWTPSGSGRRIGPRTGRRGRRRPPRRSDPAIGWAPTKQARPPRIRLDPLDDPRLGAPRVGDQAGRIRPGSRGHLDRRAGPTRVTGGGRSTAISASATAASSVGRRLEGVDRPEPPGRRPGWSRVEVDADDAVGQALRAGGSPARPTRRSIPAPTITTVPETIHRRFPCPGPPTVRSLDPPRIARVNLTPIAQGHQRSFRPASMKGLEGGGHRRGGLPAVAWAAFRGPLRRMRSRASGRSGRWARSGTAGVLQDHRCRRRRGWG